MMMLNNIAAQTERKTRFNQRGVTLTELLVVLAIIAVLSAIIAPIYINSVDSARRTKCAHQLRQIGDSVLAYEFEQRVLPGPVGLIGRGRDAKVYSIESYLIEAGYLIKEDMWVCPSNTNVKASSDNAVAHRSSYDINNTEGTLPKYFFGVAIMPRAVSISAIKANHSEGVWLLRDLDVVDDGGYSFDPTDSPGISDKQRPPHAKGRNYFFLDGHVEHFKFGAFPP